MTRDILGTVFSPFVSAVRVLPLVLRNYRTVGDLLAAGDITVRDWASAFVAANIPFFLFLFFQSRTITQNLPSEVILVMFFVGYAVTSALYYAATRLLGRHPVRFDVVMGAHALSYVLAIAYVYVVLWPLGYLYLAVAWVFELQVAVPTAVIWLSLAVGAVCIFSYAIWLAPLFRVHLVVSILIGLVTMYAGMWLTAVMSRMIFGVDMYSF
ncbi:hypothetical protein ACERZ8_01700 [Tateyamaria armeniaca]|uniref:Yip1 domain-containing protein n=1 Tax=Tateyamaria armeniaca TaxID=2518930 RepID=A0ABW8URE6_9RHOB